MSTLSETAYPRLRLDSTQEELELIYSPAAVEWKFVCQHYRKSYQRAFVIIQLKTLQRLGYFIPLNSLPLALIDHICARSGIRTPSKQELVRYDQSGSKSVHQKRIREFVNIRLLDAKGEQWLEQQAIDAAQTKQELPDIINVMLEALVQRRYELPGFTYLFRLARKFRTVVNETIYKTVYSKLSEPVIEKLDQMIESRSGHGVWDSLKREPKQPNVREIVEYLKHTDTMLRLNENLPACADIAVAKRRQFVLEAKALDLAELRQLKPLKRYTLSVLLMQAQLQKVLDDVAEIFIKTIRNLHNVAEEKLRQYQLQQAEQVLRLVGQFKEVLTALGSEGSSDDRIFRVEESLSGNLQSWINECDEHMAYAGNNYYSFILSSYGNKRSLFFKCLELLL